MAHDNCSSIKFEVLQVIVLYSIKYIYFGGYIRHILFDSYTSVVLKPTYSFSAKWFE